MRQNGTRKNTASTATGTHRTARCPQPRRSRSSVPAGAAGRPVHARITYVEGDEVKEQIIELRQEWKSKRPDEKERPHLARALRRLLDDPAEREKLGRNGKEAVFHHFHAERMARETADEPLADDAGGAEDGDRDALRHSARL